MKISVIIPAINEAAQILECISSAESAGAFEIIVVDGGSHDDTFTLAQSSNAIALACEPGRSTQQNHGASYAMGDVLLFLHADCRLDTAAINQIKSCLNSGKHLHGAFEQRINASGFLYRLLEWGNAQRVRLRGIPYGDQGIFIQKKFFEKQQGFPKVKLLEDLLLMKALRKKSWPALLPGPITIDARRWQKRGVLRQTLLNWQILFRHALGASPDELAKLYRRHDQSETAELNRL